MVVAFGQLLPVPLLEALPLGFVNVHFSLLPRWRGAAPVERAILAGDAETGVGLMQLEAGLDTGPVFARAAFPSSSGRPPASCAPGSSTWDRSCSSSNCPRSRTRLPSSPESRPTPTS